MQNVIATRTTRSAQQIWLALFCALNIFFGQSSASDLSPREQVLSLVPPEASVCFVVQNLREQAKTVAASPFAAWATAKLGAKLQANDDAKRLQQIEAFLLPLLGVTLTDLRDDIFGDCLAFAYEPGPPGQPNAERGVMLLYARDPAKLQKLIAKLNDFQKAGSELQELKEHQHGGAPYIERVRPAGASEYYFVRDHLFAFAVHEQAIHGIIDRLAKPQPSPVLKDLDELKLQNAFWACWLAPRKLDAEMKSAGRVDTPEAAGLAQVAKLWGAVDQCALYLKASESLELGVAVTYRAEALPKEVRAQFAAPPVASPLWNAIPKDAILAVAGEVEARALLDIIASFLPAAERPKLHQQIEREIGAVVGKKNVPAILAALGPDFGLWATASAESPLPRVTAAVRVKSEPDVRAPAVILQAVGFYVQMLVYGYNSDRNDQLTIVEGKAGAIDIKTIVGAKVFPAGVAPVFGLKDGYAVFGSHLTAFAGFQAPTLAPASADVPLVRVSAQALRSQITTQREGLAKFLAAISTQPEAEILKNLDTITMVLEALDSAEVVIRGDERSRTFAVKLKLVKPLK